MSGVDLSNNNAISSLPDLAHAAEFVIHKATEGTEYRDPFYRGRIDALRNLKVPVGAYHFAAGNHAAAAEADAFLAYAQPKPGDILALDVEADILTLLPGQTLVTWCKTWLDRVRAQTGTTSHVYMSAWVVNSRDWSTIAATYPLWLAAYNDTIPSIKWWGRPAIWQHTQTGRIPGVAGDVDLDITVAHPTPNPTQTEDIVTPQDKDDIANLVVTKLMAATVATVDESQANPKDPTGAWTYTVKDLLARVIRLLGIEHSNIRKTP